MDVIVVGAGAVGGVIGSLLEASGHRVTYWARPGSGRPVRPLEIEREGGAPLASQPLRWVGAGDSVAATDWVLVCVRAEQLSAALEQVVTHLGTARALAIATVTLDGALSAARDAGWAGPALALHVSFGAAFDPINPARIRWFPFSTPTTASAEGQVALLASAQTLASALAAAGLPTRSVLSMAGLMRFFVTSNISLLPAWELSGWQIDRFARDRALRLATAAAMHEAARAFAAERGFARLLGRWLPVSAYALVLRLLPFLMGERARRVWLLHGPKLHEQTRFMLTDLLERGRREQRPLPHLTELVQRWQDAPRAG